MKTELLIQGERIPVKGSFKFTRQASDIGDVSTSNANYTNSFSLIRDARTIRALKGLSLKGSLSNIPYNRTESVLLVDDIPVIRNGWMTVKESNIDTFKVSVVSGAADFWKAIQGVTLADIDLHEAEHDKTLDNFADNTEGPYFRYLVGDYGGAEYMETNIGRFINVDHQIPSINEKYILDRIFEYIGMTYSLSVQIDTWLTYPKDTLSSTGFQDEMKLDATGSYPKYDFPFYQAYYRPSLNVSMPSDHITYSTSQSRLTIGENGVYRFSFETGRMEAEYSFTSDEGGHIRTLPINFRLIVNGTERKLPYEGVLNKGDRVVLMFQSLNNTEINEYISLQQYDLVDVGPLQLTNFELTVEQREYTEISFGNALEDISASDFVKYIMMRYGLTLFSDEKEVQFLTINERLQAETQDLSRFYKARKKEQYTYSNYALKNALRHKYVNDSESFNDGYIYSNNLNLDNLKTLYESFVFSPNRDGSMQVFEGEVKQKNEEKDAEVTYKSVEGRLYSIKTGEIQTQRVWFYSEVEDDAVFVDVYYEADATSSTFKNYVDDYWPEIERIIQNAKLLTVEMDMSIIHFMNIDLKKKVYLKQEAAFFLINKAVFNGGKNVELELIKIDG